MNDDLHRQAMELFDEARLQELHGTTESARLMLESAAELEQQCADAISDDEPRSKGIIRVGAVSLWMQAGRLETAEALARRYLTESILPGYYRELHKLLNDIQRMREESRLVPSEPEERAPALTKQLQEIERELAKGYVRRVRVRSAA
jgi:hypothetical protein